MSRSILLRLVLGVFVTLLVSSCLLDYSEFDFEPPEDQPSSQAGDAGVQGLHDLPEAVDSDETE